MNKYGLISNIEFAAGITPEDILKAFKPLVKHNQNILMDYCKFNPFPGETIYAYKYYSFNSGIEIEPNQ